MIEIKLVSIYLRVAGELSDDERLVGMPTCLKKRPLE